jgi:hypothetical protein
MVKRLRWAPAENLLIHRFARALVEGRFRSAGKAARASVNALLHLHAAHPKADWAAAPRTWEAIHTRLLDYAQATGGRWPGARWTATQDSLIRPFVTGLVRGRYRSANEAAHRALNVLKPRRLSSTPSLRQSTAFSQRTVQQKILDQAEALGWRPDVREWSKQELRVLDSYGRDMKRGRYRTARAAGRAYLRDLDRLRRKYRGARWLRMDRTLNGVFIELVKRLKRLNAWSGPRWPEPEMRLLDRFARRVADGRSSTALEAACDFLSARGDMHDRHPEIMWLRRRRSLRSAARVINQRAHEMGWSKLLVRWAAPERLILERYARAIARGRYRSIPQAAPACARELARLHRLHPDARWSRPSRTVRVVQGQLQIRVKELGVPRNNGFWTPGEREIVGQFARRCGKPGYRTLVDATKECIRDLEQRHSRERRRKPWLAPVQPRTFGAVRALLRQRAIDLGTWGPNAHQGRVDSPRRGRRGNERG